METDNDGRQNMDTILMELMEDDIGKKLKKKVMDWKKKTNWLKSPLVHVVLHPSTF